MSGAPAEVRGADWYGEDLSGQQHAGLTFVGVDLTEATSDGAVFTECTFRDCRFNLSEHTDAAFLNCTFTGCSFFQAELTVPQGWTLDRNVPVTIVGPLSGQRFNAVSTRTTAGGTKLVATFNKAEIDNNVPVGAAVPLKVTANFLAGGVQKKLEGTANVRVVK